MLVTGLILYAIGMLYLIVGVWLIYMRRLLSGGLLLAVISLLPLVLMPNSPDSEAPGEGLPTALMMIPSLLLIVTGLVAFGVRASMRLVGRYSQSGGRSAGPTVE